MVSKWNEHFLALIVTLFLIIGGFDTAGTRMLCLLFLAGVYLSL